MNENVGNDGMWITQNSPEKAGGFGISGQVVVGVRSVYSSWSALIFSHFFFKVPTVAQATGCLAVPMILLMTNRISSLLGRFGDSAKLAPGFRIG